MSNNIPICPNCKNKGMAVSMAATTALVNYIPECGSSNTLITKNHDIITHYYKCNECGKEYSISNNDETTISK